MLKDLVNTIRTKVQIDFAEKPAGLSELESQVLTAEDIKTSGNREELQKIEWLNLKKHTSPTTPEWKLLEKTMTVGVGVLKKVNWKKSIFKTPRTLA
nr:unnamed protein product [Callosobruchus chinensis]